MKRKILVIDVHTFGHEAALRFIRRMGWRRRECEIIFCGGHLALLKRLTEGPAFAVVAVRNSIAGEVTEVTKALAHYRNFGYGFELVRELQLQINHCLLAPRHITAAVQLRRVMSHEKAIEQCGIFLDSIGITADRRSKKDSTGNAAKYISKLGAGVLIGAIAPKSAAKAYGLNILAEGIQDTKKNLTTFWLLENEATVKPVTVGIIGIGGRFGSVLKGFFERLNCAVIGSDPATPGMSNGEVVQQADVVIFAIPIRSTPVVIRSVLKHSRTDQLFMDITSIKEPAVTAMLGGKSQVVGLHPMFAPEVSFNGQTIVVCPARLEMPHWKTWVMNLLTATGAKLKWSTPAEHDMYMATVQASPHLANLVGAILIMEMEVSTQESLSFTSPFYHVMFSLMSRLLSQDPDMYSAIIMKNPASVKMLERRIQIEQRVLKMIRNYDRKSFRRLFLKAREYFGETVTKEANELFLRLISVTKTIYGKNTVILEFSKAQNKPGLLQKVARAFEKRKVNIADFHSVDLGNCTQFSIRFDQSRQSENVRRALEEIEGWKTHRVKVVN